LATSSAAGLIIFAWHSQATLNQVQVNGPIYRDIVQGKNLLADILPPPAYLVESYLLAFQMLGTQDPALEKRLAERSRQLAAAFEARHAYWGNALPNGPVKTLLTERAYPPGREFLAALTGEFLPAITAGDREKATRIATTVLTRHYDAHRAAIDELVALANAQQATHEKEAAATVDQSKSTVQMVAVVAFVLLAVLSFVVARSILTPLQQLHAEIGDLAGGNGDLTKRLPVGGRDELSAFCREFNHFLDTLHRTISSVVASTGTVADTTRRLSESVERIAAEARAQAGQAVHAAAAVEEMSVTSTDIAKQTAHVGATAEATAATSEQGHGIVTEAVTGISKLADMVQGSSAQIQTLGRRSDEIGEIAKVIQDIADQTNLLALNAAIEAARAGDQGRGFAVVADEVRKLAERTTKATDEIANTIRIIQSDTSQAVEAMQAGSQAAGESVTMAGQAGHCLEQVVTSVQQVSALVQQIAASVHEQSTTTPQLAANVQSVATSSQRMERSIEEVRHATETLARQAEGLKKAVGCFRLA
jgi:methyl-accepting chemotaxis protein